MNKLIEIITSYFGSVTTYDDSLTRIQFERACVNGAKGFLVHEAEVLAEKIASSGFRELTFETIQQAIIDTPDEHKFSDGYHTFESLYDIRLAYNVVLFNEWAQQFEIVGNPDDPNLINNIATKHDVHKSQRHHDGELCFGGGWFIVVANLPNGQISNHYEMKHWDLFRIPSYEKAKYEWDGHTSENVIKRLKNL